MLIRIFVFWGRLIRNYTFWGWLIQGGFFPVAFLLCINSTNLLNKLTKPSSVAAVDHLHRTQWQLTPMTSSNSRSQKQWQWQWRLTPTATTPPLAGSLSRLQPQSIAAVSAVIPNLGKGYIAFHCTQPMEFKSCMLTMQWQVTLHCHLSGRLLHQPCKYQISRMECCQFWSKICNALEGKREWGLKIVG